MAQNQPRRFAPLDPQRQKTANEHDDAPELKGIIFDVDGTLCLPQNYMFREMRSALGIPKSVDILNHIRSLSSEPDERPAASDSNNSDNGSIPSSSSPQSRALAKIQAIESTAMTKQVPQPGLQELMKYLTSRNLPKSLCTRNFPAPVKHLLTVFIPNEKFDCVITRDTVGIRPKPSPEGIWHIATQWGLHRDVGNPAAEAGLDVSGEPEPRDGNGEGKAKNLEGIDLLELAKRRLGANLIMVGDSFDDMAAGYRAGAATVLLQNEENKDLAMHEYTDLVVQRLDDLIEVLESGFVGRTRQGPRTS